jgi:hypothetical protein
MKESVMRLLKKRFARKSAGKHRCGVQAGATSKPRRGFPQVEALETRLTPTIHSWVWGAASAANWNTEHWYKDGGAQFDTSWPQSSANDEVSFGTSAGGTNSDCTVPAGQSFSVRSLTLDSTYGGHLLLPGLLTTNPTAGFNYLYGGTIDVQDSGNMNGLVLGNTTSWRNTDLLSTKQDGSGHAGSNGYVTIHNVWYLTDKGVVAAVNLQLTGNSNVFNGHDPTSPATSSIYLGQYGQISVGGTTGTHLLQINPTGSPPHLHDRQPGDIIQSGRRGKQWDRGAARRHPDAVQRKRFGRRRHFPGRFWGAAKH